MQHKIYALQRAGSQGEIAALQNGSILTANAHDLIGAEWPQPLTIRKRARIKVLFASGLREQP
jgi:hypothetical protein